MRRTVGILAVALAVAACSKKTDSGSTAARDTGPLWAFAPEGSFFGLVVADGTGAQLYAGLQEAGRLLRARPEWRSFADEALGGIVDELGMDPLDAAMWSKLGIDPGKGFAIFFDDPEDDRGLAIVPVVDRVAFRAYAEGEVAEENGREVDRVGKAVCAPLRDRYVCAPSIEVLDAAAAAGDAGALATRVGKLPNGLRGDIELVVDLSKIDGARQAIAQMAPVIDATGLLVVSMRASRGALSARGWMEGKPGPVVSALVSSKRSDAITALTRGAVSVLRVRFPPDVLAGALASSPVASVPELAGFIGQLGGELVIVTSGELLVGGAIAVAVKDAGPVRELIATGCTSLAGNLPATIEPSDHGCKGKLDVSKLADTAEVPAGLVGDELTFSLEVRDGALVARVGEAPADAADVAAGTGSTTAKDIVTGDWHFVWWGRSLDPLAALSPEQIAAIMELATREASAEDLAAFGFARWMFAHVYELGMAVAVRDDGVHFAAQVTTFAADADEAYHAYEAALGKSIDGDQAGYRQAMTALAQAHGSSLAGRQAALVAEGAPMLGAGAGVVAAVAIPAFLKYIKRSKASEAQEMLHRIGQGARMYHMDTATDGAGFGRHSLPHSIGPTPPLGTCCQSGGDKCQPDASLWADNGWVALQFSVDDPHYYSYEFVSDASSFTARAYGDLDCDGEYSTFELRGAITDEGVELSPNVFELQPEE